VGSPFGPTLLPIGMGLNPGLHFPPPPDTARRQLSNRFWELRIRLSDLMNALTGNPKHAGCFSNADEGLLHPASIEQSLDSH
jgi:hypothetical protein